MKIINLILSILLVTNVEAKSPDIREYIPDENLRSCIMSQYNIEHQDKKDNLTLDDLKNIRHLNCSSYMIANTKGIEELVNLIDLNLSNNNITNINLEKNLELGILQLKNNLLETVNVSKNINLWSLDLSNNRIKDIFLANNIILKKLDLSNNNLTSLDIQSNLNLNDLSIQGNDFSHHIDKTKSSFQTPILYNPYFQEKLENITYTSSNENVATIGEKGKINSISFGSVVLIRSYFFENEDEREEIKEINYLELKEKNEQINRTNKTKNVPYIVLFGIVLLLLGLFIIRRHLNMNENIK